MLTRPVTQFDGLGEVNFYRDFFELMDEIKFFPNKNHLQTLM